MKRIVICLDGTWQNIRQERKTNINIIARSVVHRSQDVEQFVIYVPGVGSKVDALQGKVGRISALADALGSFAGGVFGDGLEDMILETYLQLAFNYEPGDEIFIFGFSRGAFAARSLAGLIGKSGILSRRFAEKAQDAFNMYRDNDIDADHATAIEFRTKYGKRITENGVRRHGDHRPQIQFMGIFDTVGQRGLPSAFGWFSNQANKRFAFHNLNLGRFVLAARHAVAIDERRSAFPPTLWENLEALNHEARSAGRPIAYEQRWFIGSHGDVGGGARSTLSSFPLQWVLEGAEAAGLLMDRTPSSPLSEALQEAYLDPLQPITRPRGLHALHPINWGGRWRTLPRPVKGAPTKAFVESLLHPSVPFRVGAAHLKRPYRPPPLGPMMDPLLELVAGVLVVAELSRLMRKRKGWFG